MGKMSRTKGAAGERELVKVLGEAGLHARRTAMMQTQDSSFLPDVTVEEWPDVWIECKRVKKPSPRPAYRQGLSEVAETQSEKTVLAVLRGDRMPWMVYGRFDELVERVPRSPDWAMMRHCSYVGRPRINHWWGALVEMSHARTHHILTLADDELNIIMCYMRLESLLTLPRWGDRRSA